ncbi:carboxylesterase/lipase family protein [Corynebacterium tapiri]
MLGSEDCLNLDVVRPHTDDRLPVVVYFHGGSFVIGSSFEPVLRGHNLVRSMDVVYVSVNFRLGVLGYLDMRTQGDDCVATPALHDQLLALQWVAENIEAFGGDPGNVTIMGESAGAAAVASLMACPPANGLFHRAVAQSPPLAQVHSRAQSHMWTKRLLQRLGLPAHASLQELRDVELASLVRAGQSMMWRGGELWHLNSCFAPTVDGEMLVSHPLTTFDRGDQAQVPLIIGTNADEASFGKFIYQRTSRRTRAAQRFLNAYDPNGSQEVLDAYDGAVTREEFADLLADAMFWGPTIRAAEEHAAHNDTWMYRFDYAPQALRVLGLGAMHTVELSAVFADPHSSRSGSIAKLGGMQGYDEVVEHMQSHWAHFFHHGTPLDTWPTYSVGEKGRRETMIFDTQSSVIDDPKPAKRQAWGQFHMTSWGLGRPELTAELGVSAL